MPRMTHAELCEQCHIALDSMLTGVVVVTNETEIRTVCSSCAELLRQQGWKIMLQAKG